jgi:hypothetical protein
MALLLAALFVEVGIVLLIVPWSIFWDRNYFIDAFPQLQSLLTSYYVRGAVSGLGAVNVSAGIMELVAIFAARAQRPVPAPFSSRTVQE